MTVPSLPPFYDMNYTDKDGNLTTESLTHNDQTFQTLNTVVDRVNNGWTFPSYTNADIAAFGADTSVAAGTVWFSTDDSKLKLKTAAGTIVEIDSTP